jgi:arabinogalactan endo-1,4-beta-galactosidase
MKHSSFRVLPLLLGWGTLNHCASHTGSDGAGQASPTADGAPEPAPAGAAGVLSDPEAAPVSPSTSSNAETDPLPAGLLGTAGASALGAPGADAGGAAATPGLPETPRFEGSFILGADISSVQEAVDQGTLYVDTDGQQKTLLALLKNHGFNYVRLRTFLDPAAEYGYASGSGCPAKAEPYNDRDHTVAFAREVKAAGMGLLLDFHYSDTWADPGKQVIPQAWRGVGSVAALAELVRAYTVDVVGALVAAGARPDMVQVGNEITPGMLIHVPSATTDCYGNGSVLNPSVNGSQSNWDNLALLLRAGIEGVRQVDPAIQVMLHVENTESIAGVSDWVRNAQQRGVGFDVLGLSAYEAFQGPAAEWRPTLQELAQTFPELSFSIAEYNPERRLLNDIMRELPDGRGLGTFFWEPTQSGSWGESMFSRMGNTLIARPEDFAEYDQLRQDYGL